MPGGGPVMSAGPFEVGGGVGVEMVTWGVEFWCFLISKPLGGTVWLVVSKFLIRFWGSVFGGATLFAMVVERRLLSIDEDALDALRFGGRVKQEDLFGEGLLAGEVVIEGAFGDAGEVEDLFDSRGCVAVRMHLLEADGEEMLAGG